MGKGPGGSMQQRPIRAETWRLRFGASMVGDGPGTADLALDEACGPGEDGPMKASVQDLLAGPRGRRLCLEATRMLSLRVAELVFWLGYELDPGRGTSLVVWSPGGGALEAGARPAVSIEQAAQAMADLDLSGLTDEVVQAALVGTVMSARYWQEPDGEDVLAGHPAVQAALEPVAEGVLGSAVARHWGSPRAAAQWVIDWRAFEDPAPVSRDAQGVLAAWAREERRQEVRAATEHPADPTANFSGTWWSIPQGAVVSVGQIPAGLDLVEDDIGAEAATVIPVRGAGRTYEVRGPRDWVRLCRRFPLEVSASRRHDWYRVTGRSGRWVIPDWEQVASEWDAVHLTTLGYLGAATRALPVDADMATVLAGWNPDTTVWLTDTVRESEEPRQCWQRVSGDDGWARCLPVRDVGSEGPARGRGASPPVEG